MCIGDTHKIRRPPRFQFAFEGELFRFQKNKPAFVPFVALPPKKAG